MESHLDRAVLLPGKLEEGFILIAVQEASGAPRSLHPELQGDSFREYRFFACAATLRASPSWSFRFFALGLLLLFPPAMGFIPSGVP